MAVRFGVVGTAYWGAEIHAPGLLGTPRAMLVGIHGRSPDKTEQVAKRLGIRAFEAFDDLLDAVDAVSIAIPPQAQPDYARRAAGRGRHLLLEKPIATSLAEAQDVAAAIGDSDVASLVFFTRRFIPEVAQAIEANQAKDWQQAHVTIHAAPMTTDSPYRGSMWRQEDGAALWDLGPHVLSVLVPMMGDVVEARRLDAPARHVRFEARHARGGVSDVSLTLHAMPGTTVHSYRFVRNGEALVLPEPAFSRQNTLSRAAGALVEMIGSGRRDHPCGIKLGLDTVTWLAALGGTR